ncbi:MAG TPA: S8 family serine peptidase [Gaiellaceae bacterium]
MSPMLAAVAAAAAIAAPGATDVGTGQTLLQLRPEATCTDGVLLARAGATAISPELRIYRLPSAAARRLLPGLRARGAVQNVEAERRVEPLATFSDPLSPNEWWRAAVGAAGLDPPGPGTPVTIVDSGIDLSHPEFASRPDTTLLNAQVPGYGGRHGTAVASLVGAPANGIGIVGIYPQVALRSWDAAVADEGRELAVGDIVAGISAASRAGVGVINLSLGSGDRSASIEQAVNEAVRRGSLVVAASGNDGDEGNPLTYPAALPHVLTVAATNRANAVAGFSSRSRYVDLAAPGEDITVAWTPPPGYQPGDGTSFAAPLVSGAAAWVWTVRPELDNTQLFEILRRSTKDIGAPGRDLDSGFGLLDVGAALTAEAPVEDPLEPNEDIDDVRPGFGLAALTTRSLGRALVTARLDLWEDPRDVYRVWQPAGRRLVVSTGAEEDVDVAVWSQAAFSVAQQAGPERLAVSARVGTGNERTRVPVSKRGRWVYVAVTRGRGIVEAEYRLGVTPR